MLRAPPGRRPQAAGAAGHQPPGGRAPGTLASSAAASPTGNDLLKARDRTSDKTINCGAGTDRADLDLHPKDPNSVVKGCERKTRH
jgi:hypothetical protein